MSVSSVSGDSGILREEYLEQQRKLQQQKQQIAGDGGANANAPQSAEASKPSANTDASAGNQGASRSAASAAATSAATGAVVQAATDGSDASGNQAIISKANSGAELTSSELSTLKQVDPALYARVVKAQKARVELRNKMGENTSNATQITKDAISKNNAEIAEAAGDDDTKNLINRVLLDEYKNLASKYDQIIISNK
jgi:hypothetical protein